jgi:high frequency lysogenization protein
LTDAPESNLTGVESRVIALAGTLQALRLVQRVARDGVVDQEPFATSLGSLFVFDATDAEAVYGGRGNLCLGMQTLITQLQGGGETTDSEISRYWLTLMLLERQLAKRPSMMDTIQSDLMNVEDSALGADPTNENAVARIGAIYENTISTLNPRVMVTGEPHLLTQSFNAARIRSLLLAGIRGVVLWRQMKGTRLSLALSRKRLMVSARQLLTSAEALRSAQMTVH